MSRLVDKKLAAHDLSSSTADCNSRNAYTWWCYAYGHTFNYTCRTLDSKNAEVPYVAGDEDDNIDVGRHASNTCGI